MEKELNNTVSAVGNYNNIRTAISSENLAVTMIDGLDITKTADKQVWVDGDLTYTIVLKNETNKTYTSPIVTDILDDNLVFFVDKSVTIDLVEASSSDYTYRSDTHTLTVNLTDIEPSGTKTISFKVSKKQ